MKKIAVVMLICVLAAGSAFAALDPTEEDYKNLEETRTKLVRMKKEMDKFMKDMMAAYPDEGSAAVREFGQGVTVDIAENDKEVIVKADLPGMEKDKIEVTLENNRFLKIAGSREAMKKETAPGMVKQERMQGRFERVLELPVDCMSENIKATYNNGVLEVVIPKMKKAQEKAVKVSVQ